MHRLLQLGESPAAANGSSYSTVRLPLRVDTWMEFGYFIRHSRHSAAERTFIPQPRQLEDAQKTRRPNDPRGSVPFILRLELLNTLVSMKRYARMDHTR